MIKKQDITYSTTLKLPQSEINYCNSLLAMRVGDPKQKYNETVTCLTAKFSDGCEVDIKVVNGNEECGPWLDVILFDDQGWEITALPPEGESVVGEFDFYVELDGKKMLYHLEIEPE